MSDSGDGDYESDVEHESCKWTKKSPHPYGVLCAGINDDYGRESKLY